MILFRFVSVIFLFVFSFSSSVYAANGAACKVIKRTSENRIGELTEHLNCAEMPVGQTKTISKARDLETGHTMVSNYTLTKTAAKKYKMEFNIDFIDGMLSHFKETASTKDMADKVKLCLKNVSPYMLGPNGEQIELVAVTNSEERKMKHWGLRNSVLILQPHYYSNSRAYSKAINCATILHEVLHLTGLVDEYEEIDEDVKSDVKQNLFNCRVLAAQDSIMSNQELALTKVGLNADGEIDSNIKKSNAKSLLHPAHFRALIYPGCQKKNSVYYKCSERAYTTGVGGKCAPLPSECSGDWLK